MRGTKEALDAPNISCVPASTPTEIDGVFGPRTKAAVRDFQQSKGLPDDGIVDPQTWPRLVVQVRRGSEGPAVRAVQEVMKFHAHASDEGPPVQVDGIFGPRTDAWVRGFQTAGRDVVRRDRRADHVARARKRDAFGLESDDLHREEPRSSSSPDRALRRP